MQHLAFISILKSRKSTLALVGLVGVVVLAALERVTGEAALAAITVLCGVASASLAYEDKGKHLAAAVRKDPEP
jgi:hypothetical protein